jgi:hypothetical protein
VEFVEALWTHRKLCKGLMGPGWRQAAAAQNFRGAPEYMHAFLVCADQGPIKGRVATSPAGCRSHPFFAIPVSSNQAVYVHFILDTTAPTVCIAMSVLHALGIEHATDHALRLNGVLTDVAIFDDQCKPFTHC